MKTLNPLQIKGRLNISHTLSKEFPVTLTLNSSPRLTEDDLPKNLTDYLTADRNPLIDGTKVEISQYLIDQTEVANQICLPVLGPNEAMIAPVADELSDADIEEHVHNTLSSTAIIASARLVLNLLNRAYATRREEIVRLHERLIERQDEMPKKIPASKRKDHPPSWQEELKAFFLNWSSLACALLATALVSAIFIEIMYQISALQESSWGLVQNFFGAFGFSWGFTVAVVVATYWHSTTRDNPLTPQLSKRMSLVAFWLAWGGLAGFGFMLGLTHSFEGGDGWSLPPLRCVLTTVSVLSLGMICVAIEKGVDSTFRSSYGKTLVLNEEVDAMDAEIHVVVNQLTTLAQLEDLAARTEERIKQHIRSQIQPWLRRRDAIRSENRRQEAATAEEIKIQLSQQRLASLQKSNAA